MKLLVQQEDSKKQIEESSLSTSDLSNETISSQSEDSSTDKDMDTHQLDIRYIMKDLGCKVKRVIKNEELLDQFLVMKAIMDKNLTKLSEKDVKILQQVVSDVFPEISITQVISGGKKHIVELIDQRLARRNFFRGVDFIQSVFTLYEALHSRHGIMVLGDPACGKTTSIRIMQEVLHALH